MVLISFWTSAEISGGFLCGCLPVLPPLFQAYGSRYGFYLGRRYSEKKSPNPSHQHPDSHNPNRSLPKSHHNNSHNASFTQAESSSNTSHSQMWQPNRDDDRSFDRHHFHRIKAPQNLRSLNTQGSDAASFDDHHHEPPMQELRGDMDLQRNPSQILKTVHIESAKKHASSSELGDLEKQQREPWTAGATVAGWE